ncbi:MAG: TorF family putative porin [Gammaproteobacteria bacterium]|nr:TorF family putative porin [Gammaproteobacteria bacterium]
MRIKHVFIGCVAAVLTCTPAFADEEDGGFSGNVTIASDYSFRGVSQTNLLPAIQGGFDYELDNGFSFGTWASNVNYGDGGTSQELDLYVGFTQSLNDTTSVSFSLVQLEYPGDGENLDYQEIGASLDMGSISLGFVYSPSYVGVNDWQFNYLSVGYGMTLGENVDFSASIGLNSADDIAGEGEDSYIDYSVGVSVPIGGIDLGFNVVGTNIDDNELGEGRLVFSLSKSL